MMMRMIRAGVSPFSRPVERAAEGEEDSPEGYQALSARDMGGKRDSPATSPDSLRE